MLKAVFGSMTFHIAVGVGLLSTAWWWTTDGDVRKPPELAVSLKEAVPEVTQEAPPVSVEPPIETEVEIIPLVEVDATPLDVLEDLPLAEDYKAVRPWMPRGLRYRPTKLPPHLREQVEAEQKAVARIPSPAAVVPSQPEPQATVLLAPSIDATQCPPPEYPRRARRMRWEGVTQLLVTVDTNGNPLAIKVSVSSGHQILDDAAIGAVQKWRFHPAKRDGVQEVGDLLVPIRFGIKG